MHRTLDPRTEALFSKLMRRKSVQELLPALRSHHPDTYDHSLRVAKLSIDLALENDLPVPVAMWIGCAGLLHDFGKTGVSTAILDKDGPLSDTERAEMQRHCRLTFVKLRKKVSESVRQLAVAHHEFKASAYPRNHRDRRESIRPHPVERRAPRADVDRWAQIVAAADMFDALASERAYKRSLDPTKIEGVMSAEFRGTKRLISQVVKRHTIWH